MAGIREVFEIVDRATAPLRNVQAAMGGVVNQTVILNVTLNENVQTQQAVERAVKQTDSAARTLTGTIGRLVAAFGGLKLIKGAIDLSDELSLTQARLNNINDGLQTTAELQDMIYQSAQRSRGSYVGMMQTVANLKAQTGDTFSSVREAVAFTELLQKQFKIAGADAAAVSSTMYNLTQALSTGVLRGQDLNIVMSNAPQIAQRIAKTMGVSLGQLKEMASQGQVTSNVVKRAMFEAADDINQQFENMPMTFGDAAEKLKNIAVRSFQPIGQMLADSINSGEVEQAMDATGQGIYFLAGLVGVFVRAFTNGLARIASALIDTGGKIGWLGSIFILLSGIVTGVAAVIVNTFNNMGNMVITVAEFVYNAWAEAVSAILTAVKNFVTGAASSFRGVAAAADAAASAIANAFIAGANAAIGGINGLINAINQIPGINIGNVSTVGGFGGTNFAGTVDAAIKGIEALDTAPTLKMFERLPVTDVGDAWSKGNQAGTEWATNLLNGMNAVNDTGNMEDILHDIDVNTANAVPNGSGGNVGKVGKVGKVDNVKLSDEDRKIYRDLAERRYMNNIELKTLAPEITVNLPAGASGNFTADDVADKIKKILIEQMAAQTSVAHA